MYKFLTILRKNQSKAIVLCFSVVFLCCKATQSLVPNDSDVIAAQAHWAGITKAELSDGYSIFSDKCTECHGTKKPGDFTVEEWNNILPNMGAKAHLDSNQYNLVYHYILAKRETLLAGKK